MQNDNIEVLDNFKWSPGDIRCLIHLYEEFFEKFDRQPKKKVWSDIAEKLSETRNKRVTGEQCDGKFKGLKSMYKKVRDHNNKSGNSAKKWEYLEIMDELLNKRPEINPPATCTSDEPNVRINNTTAVADGSSEYDFVDCIIEESTIISPPSSILQRKRKAPDEGKNKRHMEKMERQDRFLDLFSKLIDKI